VAGPFDVALLERVSFSCINKSSARLSEKRQSFGNSYGGAGFF